MEVTHSWFKVLKLWDVWLLHRKKLRRRLHSCYRLSCSIGLKSWVHQSKSDTRRYSPQVLVAFQTQYLGLGLWGSNLMGMDGLLGVAGMMKLLVMTGIIPENSLRLASVRWSRAVKSMVFRCFQGAFWFASPTNGSAVAQQSRPRQTPSGTTARRTSLSVLGQVLPLLVIGSPAFLMTTCSIFLLAPRSTWNSNNPCFHDLSRPSREKDLPTSTLWLWSHGDQLGSFAVLPFPGVSGAFFCALSESAGA